MKTRNYVARAKQSGAGKHKDQREVMSTKRLTEELTMLDREKVAELADNVRNLMDLHQRKDENVKKLMRICIKHLEDRRRLIPEETWAERQQLIDALKTMTEE